jgi:hypothetical protein
MTEALSSRCRQSEAMAKVEGGRAGQGGCSSYRDLRSRCCVERLCFLAQGKCGPERVVPST